jgi:hypothetical protein
MADASGDSEALLQAVRRDTPHYGYNLSDFFQKLKLCSKKRAFLSIG